MVRRPRPTAHAPGAAGRSPHLSTLRGDELPVDDRRRGKAAHAHTPDLPRRASAVPARRGHETPFRATSRGLQEQFRKSRVESPARSATRRRRAGDRARVSGPPALSVSRAPHRTVGDGRRRMLQPLSRDDRAADGRCATRALCLDGLRRRPSLLPRMGRFARTEHRPGDPPAPMAAQALTHRE